MSGVTTSSPVISAGQRRDSLSMMDEVISDWKMRLEIIIGSALKGMRKHAKDVKAMSGKSGITETDLMEAWRTKFQSDLSAVSKNVANLNTNIGEAVEKRLGKMKSPTVSQNNNKKTIINLEYKPTMGFGGSLKHLMSELDKICNVFGSDQGFKSFVPIYEAKKPTLKYVEENQPDFHNFNNISLDVTNEQTINVDPSKDMKKEKKRIQRDSEDSFEAKNYKVLHFKEHGKDRYFLVKKKTKFVKKVNEDPEDIFSDCRKIFNSERSQQRSHSNNLPTKRVRRISHRSSRKNDLKEMERELVRKRVLSYSEVVKKNIKSVKEADPEDTFELWLDIFDAGDQEQAVQEYELEQYFHDFRHNFSFHYEVAGLPSVESIFFDWIRLNHLVQEDEENNNNNAHATLNNTNNKHKKRASKKNRKRF